MPPAPCAQNATANDCYDHMLYLANLISKNKTSASKGALVFFILLFMGACSSKTLRLFFDVPPPDPNKEIVEEINESDTSSAPQAGLWLGAASGSNNQEPLPIEDLSTWEEVLALLPKDYKKKPDWSAALTEGLIRPRPGLDYNAQYASVFKYDFIMAADKPKNEAYFPHSAHTQWLGCKNCHMTLYPYKRNPATMKEMRAGASCGKCHGNVAFSLKHCKRCHLKR